jgi:outer membrane protein OmpA-like peptidoglycan-associated protein
MKKTLVSAMVLSLILQAPVFAGEAMPVGQGQSLKGPAIGALAGGLLAGPPGLIAGVIGGALIGEIEAQKDRNREVAEALSISRQQTQALSRQQAYEHAGMLRQIEQNHARLEAVSEGFSFCLGFRTESAAIEPGLEPHLRALAAMLNAFAELDIEVRAAADRRGGDAYNLELARLRADAVVRRLVAAGVSAKRIRLKISGEQVAVYPESDLEGLGFDRYVVLSFVTGDAS